MRKEIQRLFKKFSLDKTIFNQDRKTKPSKETPHTESVALEDIKARLNSVSSSFCLAKWLQVSLHLTTGKTHSCYHPPAHDIDKTELKKNPSALHNTSQKKKERRLMMKGQRPKGCSYCWRIEDSGDHFSDRHYRSLEPWAIERFKEVSKNGSDYNVIPSYVEVNFNQACQFKCSYCSPHLSSTWMEEVLKFGPYPTTIAHNDVESLKKQALWPIPLKEHNPYVEAFWKWWPELYPKLKVFRMTGGEPLIDHNTFRVLDYIDNHPNENLELAITTNLCPPLKMRDRFVKRLKAIMKEKKIFRFMLFPSIDSWGPQAEYIRYGLNTKEFEENLREILTEIPDVLVSFIVTMNALSPFNIKTLLEKFLEWERKYNYFEKGRRVFFDLPYLRFPEWQALNVLPQEMATFYLTEALSFMKKNPHEPNKGKRYGFSPFQVNKMKRLLDIVREPILPKKQRENQVNFYKFFKTHDERRNTNFAQTFPELKDFWFQCQTLAREWDEGEQKKAKA